MAILAPLAHGRSWLARSIHRASFDNRRFWNRRYVEDPAKGSGPGSRGENLRLKVDLIRSIVENDQIRTVLDIGCGDIAVVRSLPIGSYFGIDISDVVVERNRQIKPEWRFVCADLTGPFVPPPAELVLCLDVLIHQRSSRAYLAILSKTLAAAGKVALISGYSGQNPGWNVFYHEPLTSSIRRLCPEARIERLAEYRDTDLLRVEK